MNLRKISDQELESTLVNLDKIFKESGFSLFAGELEGLDTGTLSQKVLDAGYKFYSAFENGGEIGTAAVLDNEIAVLAVKNYAKGRGVGRELVEFILADFPLGERIKVNAAQEAVSFYSHLGFSPDDPANPVEEKNGLKSVPMHRDIK